MLIFCNLAPFPSALVFFPLTLKIWSRVNLERGLQFVAHLPVLRSDSFSQWCQALLHNTTSSATTSTYTPRYLQMRSEVDAWLHPRLSGLALYFWHFFVCIRTWLPLPVSLGMEFCVGGSASSIQ